MFYVSIFWEKSSQLRAQTASSYDIKNDDAGCDPTHQRQKYSVRIVNIAQEKGTLQAALQPKDIESSFGWWFGTFLLFHRLGSSSSQSTNSYFLEGSKAPSSHESDHKEVGPSLRPPKVSDIVVPVDIGRHSDVGPINPTSLQPPKKVQKHDMPKTQRTGSVIGVIREKSKTYSRDHVKSIVFPGYSGFIIVQVI